MRPEGNPGHERLVQRARRRCGGGVGLGVGEVTGDDEPPKDPGPALEDQLRVEIWVVGAGSVDEPGEQGGLGPAEAVGGGVEVAAARGLQALGLPPERKPGGSREGPALREEESGPYVERTVSAQAEVRQRGRPVRDDRVLGVGEGDGAGADGLLELVLDGVLVGGGLGAVLRLGPEVELALGGTAKFEGTKWSSS